MKLPEVIYVQLKANGDVFDTTWKESRTNDNDVPYVLATHVAELEATMEFYANSDNYKENYDGLNAPYTNVVKDGGKRARRALERKP